MKLYPLLFEPLYFNKIWGGNKISRHYQRNLNSPGIGESWELISNSSYSSKVTNGNLYGTPLKELFCKEIMGSYVTANYSYFPLLIKYIDAADDLSVQVHPSHTIGKDTKNEMWYFIDAPESGEIICGVDKNFSIQSIQDSLCKMKVKRGDSVFIPSGAVHAITKGSFVLEIQEPTDITYRLYDWDRTNPDGTTRELHVEEAVKNTVTDYTENDFVCNPAIMTDGNQSEISLIKKCSHFTVEKWIVKRELKTTSRSDRFSIINVLSGTPSLESDDHGMVLIPGDTVLIPAELGSYTLYGPCELIHSYV